MTKRSKGRRVALVTGANKGIGFEISRQLAGQGMTVVIGARNEARVAEAATRLRSEGLDIHHVRLDVTDLKTIEPLPQFFEEQFGGLDILVNNAAILLDEGTPFDELEINVLRKTFETNFFGVFAVTKALLPLIRRSEMGRIVNLSSELGSLADLSDPESPYAGFLSFAYSASKVSLNALTVLLAKELRGSGVKVNSADPGWVKTDMGTEAAPLTPEEGADTPVWLATLPADGPTGGFFSSRQPLAW
ncbi:MAG TPA: SDR family oxidoreductase [Candidatus Angelobacter sp.]|nr:SDR family oxidoreductase [Candidatus Angelobacter sp.]